MRMRLALEAEHAAPFLEECHARYVSLRLAGTSDLDLVDLRDQGEKVLSSVNK
jgi:hypothetical protein